MTGFKLEWPVDNHIINQYFGENPEFYAPFGLAGHEGLDLFAPMNSHVYACAAGEVYQVGYPANHPYGLHIRIRHAVGGQVYKTIYAHLAEVLVSQGQQVQTGQLIAKADNTGNSFGSHLHLTLKIEGQKTAGYPDEIVDPWPYMETSEAPPASDLVVYPIDILSLRAQPTTSSARLAILQEGEPLTVLGDADVARAKIGQEGAWLQVQTQSGQTGYAAAWYVRLTGQAPPASTLTVYPTDVLSLRAQASTTSNRLTLVQPDDPLTVLGDANLARIKIGQYGQWLNVRAPSGHVGYVAAWFVQLTPASTPAPQLTVYPTDEMNIRAQPTINSPRVGRASTGEPLTVIDDRPHPETRVGQDEQWLYIQTPTGERGWAAAWFLSRTKP